MNDNRLDRLEKLNQLLAADLAKPLKDAAGIIIPAGVDAAHRAVGGRRMIEALEQLHDSTGPDQAHNQ